MAIKLGIVSGGADKYCSLESRRRVTDAIRRNRNVMRDTIATANDGSETTLLKMSDASVSNPLIRRGELMVRARGMEELASDGKHEAQFITVTCPSRMHAIRSDGKRNINYDGTTPKQAQEYLVTVWARVRAQCARDGVRMFGLRVAEPHHDGCPHWHLLLFVAADDGAMVAVGKLKAAIITHALADSGNEPGAASYRVKFVSIDPARGTAAGYIAKYIAKNLGFDPESFGKSTEKNANINGAVIAVTGDDCRVGRGVTNFSGSENFAEKSNLVGGVIGWARSHGIRQFQQIGNPPVGLWRQLRKISPETVANAPEYIIAACKAVHRDDKKAACWASYVREVGSAYGVRAECRITIARGWSLKPARYGGQVGYISVGVADLMKVLYFCNLRSWSFDYRPGASPLGLVSITVRKGNNHGRSPTQNPVANSLDSFHQSAVFGRSRSCQRETP